MFSLFHKYKNSILKTVLAFFVAVLMLSFGMDMFRFDGRHKQNVAIKINNTEIGLNQLKTAENEIRDRTLSTMQAQYGEMFDKIRPQLERVIESDLSERATEELIQKTLMQDLLYGGGLTVSDDAVKEKIKKSIEAIPSLGKLNKQTYSLYLRGIGISENRLVEQTRELILIGTIVQFLSDSFVPLKTEIEDTFHKNNNTYNFSYAEFNSSAYKNKVRVDDNELKSFFEGRQENYREEKSVTYYATEFAPRSYENAVELLEEDIENEYLRRSSEFRIPPKWTLRQIVIKKNDDNDEAKKELALNVKARLNNGESFSALEKEFSEGLLGTFEYKDIPQSIRDKVVDLNKGELTEIINTGDAYIIVLAEDIVPETSMPLDAVKAQIISGLKKELSPAYARNAAEKFRDDWQSREDREMQFRAFAADKSAKVVSMTARAAATSMGTVSAGAATSQVDSVALRLPGVGSTEIVEVSNEADERKFVMVVVDSVKDARVPEIDAVKDRVANDFRQEKAVELAYEAAERILEQIRNEDTVMASTNLANLAKGEGVEAKKIHDVKRTESSSLPLLQNQSIKDTLFNLTIENNVAGSVMRLGDSFYVLSLDSIVMADESKLDEQREAIIQQQRAKHHSELLNALVSNLKLYSKVWINPEFNN